MINIANIYLLLFHYRLVSLHRHSHLALASNKQPERSNRRKPTWPRPFWRFGRQRAVHGVHRWEPRKEPRNSQPGRRPDRRGAEEACLQVFRRHARPRGSRNGKQPTDHRKYYRLMSVDVSGSKSPSGGMELIHHCGRWLLADHSAKLRGTSWILENG
jgi:hypothetical protein